MSGDIRTAVHEWFVEMWDTRKLSHLSGPGDELKLTYLIEREAALAKGAYAHLSYLQNVERKYNDEMNGLWDVNDELVKGGIEPWRYETMALAVRELAKKAGVPEGCNDHVHSVLMKFTRDDICQACGEKFERVLPKNWRVSDEL